MGIPRKGSRKVEVDGKPYRYIVKETHVEGHRDQKELSVTVQEDVEAPGRVLQWRWPYGVPLMADDVRGAVRTALAKGWVPSQRGPTFCPWNDEAEHSEFAHDVREATNRLWLSGADTPEELARRTAIVEQTRKEHA